MLARQFQISRSDPFRVANMRRKEPSLSCVACGRPSLDKNERGINQKLLGEKIRHYYCLSCLADYLECTVDDLLDKIEEFKEEGCRLFQ